MGRVNTPILGESAKLVLEHDFQTSQVYCYRMRRQVTLLKSIGRKTEEVDEITGITYGIVNAWVKRYNDFGIGGLRTKPSQGRKRILNKEPVEKSYKINIWGHFNRYNKNRWAITEQNINANFVFEQLEKLQVAFRSFQIQKQTVVMLDNASIHKAKIIQQQLKF